MKNIYTVICTFFLLCTTGGAYADDTESLSFIDILFPDGYAGWATADLGLAYRGVSNYYRGGIGFNLDVGVNLARFFSNKTIFAPFVGIEVTWCNKWVDSFVDDLNDSYIPVDYNSEMDSVDRWSLDKAQYTVIEPMLKGETANNGACVTWRLGGVIGLPWRYIPVMRAYWLYTCPSASEDGGVTYTDGTSSGGSSYGPSIPGWGIDMELFRGFGFMSDSVAGSGYIFCVRIGLEYSDISNSKLTEKDDIDGIRVVRMKEFVNESFRDKYANAWTIIISFNAISLR